MRITKYFRDGRKEVDVKYLQTGEEVVLITEIEQGFLVRFVVDYDGEEYLGSYDIVDKVFDTAPTQKYVDEVKWLKSQIVDLEQQIRELHREKSNLLNDINRGKRPHIMVGF